MILPGSVPGADLQAISGDAPLRTSDQDLQALGEATHAGGHAGLGETSTKACEFGHEFWIFRHAWESWKDIDEFYDEF